MFLAFIDEKLLAFYCLEIFNDYSSNIEARNMIIPPFNASHHDDSNKYQFMFLQDLGDEQMLFNFLQKMQFFKNFFNFYMCKFHNVSFSINAIKIKFNYYICLAKMQRI